MLEKLRRLPYPVCGVILALFSLGNCLSALSIIRWTFFCCGIILLGFIILKMFLLPNSLKESLLDPISCGILGNFSMSLMVLSTYFYGSMLNFSFFVWLIGLICHIFLIIYFSFYHIPKLKWQDFHASCFVVYIGLAMAAVTALGDIQIVVGRICFYISFTCLLLLMPLMIYRYLRYRDIPWPQKPLFCIMAAPAALIFTAYLAVFTSPGRNTALFCFTIVTFFYVITIIRVPFIIKTSAFYPSYASLTFPFVINAVALKSITAQSYDFWGCIVLSAVETGIALIFTIAVLLLYLQYWLLEKDVKGSCCKKA